MSKHMTLDDRLVIQRGLAEGKNFSEIAREISKSSTTVFREVQKHLVFSRKGAYGRSFNECVHRFECKKSGLCADKPDCVTKNCRFCSQCSEHCADFEKEICSKLLCTPYVCNGCKEQRKCTLEKRIYDAVQAYKEYTQLLTEAREGFNLTEDEYHYVDEFLSERIKQGQSIYHIVHTSANVAPCSESTMYRLVRSGVLTVRPIDLPRAVRFKPRRSKSSNMKIDRECRKGREYENYCQFVKDNPDITVAEMDSVEGKKGGSVLLTIILTNCNFMLAFKREHNNAQSVIDVFNHLYATLPTDVYRSMFGIVLGDNGTEFSNPTAIEYADKNCTEQRTRVFYCHPSAPHEKGTIENNHEMIRKVIPKGVSMDPYTQQDINKLMSHINSYGRPKYNGLSPTELFVRMYGEDTLHLLGQQRINSEDITLTPALLR